ncbi:mammalian cell entry protein [Mycolicibacterium vaccae]|uniref:mammalian cell entry protein n=1 Tax=Mycolicibacterium vaccae TaxID=1810 RepID=UPI003D0093D6
MEDRQPGSGDLTSSAPAEPDAAAEAPKTPVGKAARQPRTPGAQPESPESDGEVAPEGDAEDAGQDAGEDVVLVPHRPAGRRALIATAIAAVLFVGGSAFAGAAVQPYLMQRALVQTKLDIARTATQAITALWTYTPEDMSTLADRATVYLGGDFAQEYRRYIDAIVEPNKQAQVTNSTQVMGAAVESLAPAGVPTEATAIVYTNSVATSPVTKNIPSLRYLSYRLTMQRDGREWLITRMSTITTFDLTPQV